MDLKDVEVTFIKCEHGTDYDTEYLLYGNIDNYFFKNNATKETYRWSVTCKGKYYSFNEKAKYKLSANIARKDKWGTRITYTKVKELVKNTYGQEIWRDVTS